MKDEDLVDAYLSHAETFVRDRTEGEHFAADDELRRLVWYEPERAWPIICDIIQRTSADDILAYVAAGPLEDLLVRHARSFIERVESLCEAGRTFSKGHLGRVGLDSDT